MTVLIRPAGPADAGAVARVLVEAFRAFRPLYTAEAMAATTPPAEGVRARMGEGPTWVAVRGDAAVGTVSAVGRGRRLYVRGMGVLPEARGSGAGRALLAAVEQYAHDGGYEALYLHTTPYLDRAIRLYEAAGFRRTAEGPGDLHGTPLFAMEKPLPPGVG